MNDMQPALVTQAKNLLGVISKIVRKESKKYDVTIMSKNTGHYWYLHDSEYSGEGSVVIFHKHKFSHPYHQHGRANTLRQAVKGIKSHDKWQMRRKGN